MTEIVLPLWKKEFLKRYLGGRTSYPDGAGIRSPSLLIKTAPCCKHIRFYGTTCQNDITTVPPPKRSLCKEGTTRIEQNRFITFCDLD